MADSQRPKASRASCVRPSVHINVFRASRCTRPIRSTRSCSLFGETRQVFVPRNEAVSNASLFQVVAGGFGGALHQSGITWWPRPCARQQASVNKGLASAKYQANLQVSIHLSIPNES